MRLRTQTERDNSGLVPTPWVADLAKMPLSTLLLRRKNIGLLLGQRDLSAAERAEYKKDINDTQDEILRRK